MLGTTNAKLYIEPIPSWSTGTDAQIVRALQRHYNNEIDLHDYWNIGDERVISLSAMSATGVGESHEAQTVTMVLMDTGSNANYKLSDDTIPAFIVGQKNGLLESGYINSLAMSNGAWEDCMRRTWCNEVYREAFPSSIKSIFKQFKTVTATEYDSSTVTTSIDYFALPAEKETIGLVNLSNTTESAALKIFSYYSTPANRIKKAGDSGSDSRWWMRSPSRYNSQRFCVARDDGTNSSSLPSNSAIPVIAPFGCI